MARGAERASDFLKTLSNESRLRILCLLLEGEMAVSAISERLNMRQSSVSQQLQRLRSEKLVSTRRQGKGVFYRITSREVMVMMETLDEIYCGGGEGDISA